LQDRGKSCPCRTLGGRFPGLEPVGREPALGGRHELIHCGTVDRLADDVGVAGMAGGLLDEVQQDPAP
jgi:hypothetical protein